MSDIICQVAAVVGLNGCYAMSSLVVTILFEVVAMVLLSCYYVILVHSYVVTMVFHTVAREVVVGAVTLY